MNKYENGKIYKIVDNTNNNIYIGSTCEPTLARRLAGHRCIYNKYLKTGCNFISSFDILKNNDYNIILLESYPCKNRDELLARERYYIDNNNCINKNRPIITEDEKKELIKEYNETNKDKIKEYYKQYRESNKYKELKKEYYNKNIEEFKKYYEDNKDKNKNQYLLYRELNKDKIKNKFVCECGGKYTYNGKSTHLKTLKHLKYCESINNKTDSN